MGWPICSYCNIISTPINLGQNQCVKQGLKQLCNVTNKTLFTDFKEYCIVERAHFFTNMKSPLFHHGNEEGKHGSYYRVKTEKDQMTLTSAAVVVAAGLHWLKSESVL